MQTSDVKEMWSAVKAKREELERELGDTIYLTSIASTKRRIKGGVVSVATPQIAAMMIVDETHRLATKSEIRAWQEEHLARGAQIRTAAQKKDGKPDWAGLVDAVRQSAPLYPPMAEPAPAKPEHRSPPPPPAAQSGNDSQASQGRGQL